MPNLNMQSPLTASGNPLNAKNAAGSIVWFAWLAGVLFLVRMLFGYASSKSPIAAKILGNGSNLPLVDEGQVVVVGSQGGVSQAIRFATE